MSQQISGTKTAPKDERSVTPISDVELERRWSAARAHMREAEIDALVVGGANGWAAGYFRWFTGEGVDSGNPRTVLFPVEGLMTLVEHGPLNGEMKLDGSDPANRGIGRRLTTPSHLFSVCYTGGQDAELIAREIRRAGCRTVGLVGTVGMYHGFCGPLKEALSGVSVRDSTDAIDRIKAVKSAEEIGLIRRAAAMQDETIAAIRKIIRPGMRDFEISAQAEYLGHLYGSDQGIFLGSSAAAGRAAVFRARSQQGRPLRAGDTFTLLIENNGPGGFYTEIARAFVLGKASQEQVEAVGNVIEARGNILKRLKPGTPCRDIWEAHNAFMRARGLPEEKRLNCHNQGYDLVERPLMRFDETMTVAENMNIACHPGYVTERNFAVLCDNFLIGPDGVTERLHRTPEELIEL